MVGEAAESGIDAGEFGAWLNAMRAALQGAAGTQVPCGDCRGCCISGYSIKVRPEDRPARAHIPEHLLVFRGGVGVMPALADGRCPMAIPEGCSIYAHRPQTCLDYDCRVFAAAGIDAGDASKVVINTRVRAWRFCYADDEALRGHAAVRAAAAFMRAHPEEFPAGQAPLNPMSIAVFAVKTYSLFLKPEFATLSAQAQATAILAAAREFDAAGLL